MLDHDQSERSAKLRDEIMESMAVVVIAI